MIKNFSAGGKLNDVRDVQIGSVSASMYALVADGHNGMRVVQMISPENVPGHMGFSPVPNPKLIATYPTKAAAVTISRGLDRDRVVDESGNQTVVFGRRGSRPFNTEEMKTFFRKATSGEYGTDSLKRNGPVYKVADVKRGNKGELFDTRGRTLQPTDDFISPEVAEDEKEQPYAGRLRRRRAPEDLK